MFPLYAALLISVAVGTSQIAVPVHRYHTGQPYINATIRELTGDRVIPMNLSPLKISGTWVSWDDDHFGSPSAYIGGVRFEYNVTLDLGRVRIIERELLLSDTDSYHMMNYRDLSSIAIGRGSNAVEKYGSVDFVQSSDGTASIILNSTVEWYRTTACHEDSVISIPYNTSIQYSESVRFEVGVGSSALTTVDFEFFEGPFLLSLPEDLISSVFRITQMSSEDCWPISDSCIFERCSAIRPLLPTFRLVADELEITLTPQDYTRELGENDRCDLLVRSLSPASDWSLNPFMFPDMNVRITNSTFYICDSNITPGTRLE